MLALLLWLAQAPAQACAVSDEPAYATTKEQPVQVGGGAMYVAARERRYLDVLRGPAGEPLQFKRLGSGPGADDRTILDKYEVTYAGLEKPVYLFLDAYHFDDALKAPKGFTCAAAIALPPPSADPFLAGEATLRLAVERAARDVPPISLDEDGSGAHGVLFDRFRLTLRAARAAGASGTPLDPKNPPRDVMMAGMVVVAYPLRCGDKPPVTPGAIDVVALQGGALKHDAVATGDALARLLPGVTLPPGSAAITVQLERPRPTDTIRIAYPESGCGPPNEVSLPMKYSAGKTVNMPMPQAPAGQPADRPVYVQALVDVDGSIQQPQVIGGPPALAATALDAVRGWTAEPTRLNGAPLITPALFQVRFTPR